MKSIFTLFFAVLSVFGGTAQDLTFSQDSITLGFDENINFGDISLTNNSDSAIDIAVKLERVCLANGDETKIFICFVSMCFNVVNETTTWGEDCISPFLILEPGTTFENLFSFSTMPHGSHESEWNFVLFDRNNPETSATLNVSIEDPTLEACTPTSTNNDFDYTIGKAYPNPALDAITISYDITVNEADLNIYNSTGMLVETVVVNPHAESVSVNVANYVNGVYFYNVTDGKGQSKMMSFVK